MQTYFHCHIFKSFSAIILIVFAVACNPRVSQSIRKNDLEKDIQIITDSGSMVVRLSDSTPLHRDNFIRLVKSGFYDGISFHRVIKGFMIQAGDPRTKKMNDKIDTNGRGHPRYIVEARKDKIPAEFKSQLFHKKGVLAAAREGDSANPSKGSSYSQFYLVQGRVFTDFSLDSTELYRLKGRKIPAVHREVYKTLGGSPHLDQNYTVFGEVIQGVEVIDRIAGVKTAGREGADKPIADVRIQKMRLVPRK